MRAKMMKRFMAAMLAGSLLTGGAVCVPAEETAGEAATEEAAGGAALEETAGETGAEAADEQGSSIYGIWKDPEGGQQVMFLPDGNMYLLGIGIGSVRQFAPCEIDGDQIVFDAAALPKSDEDLKDVTLEGSLQPVDESLLAELEKAPEPDEYYVEPGRDNMLVLTSKGTDDSDPFNTVVKEETLRLYKQKYDGFNGDVLLQMLIQDTVWDVNGNTLEVQGVFEDMDTRLNVSFNDGERTGELYVSALSVEYEFKWEDGTRNAYRLAAVDKDSITLENTENGQLLAFVRKGASSGAASEGAGAEETAGTEEAE